MWVALSPSEGADLDLLLILLTSIQLLCAVERGLCTRYQEQLLAHPCDGVNSAMDEMIKAVGWSLQGYAYL